MGSQTKIFIEKCNYVVCTKALEVSQNNNNNNNKRIDASCIRGVERVCLGRDLIDFLSGRKLAPDTKEH